VFNFTITIKSTNLGSDTIVCQADASVVDTVSFVTLTESASVKATVSEATAKCTVTIPYSWALKSPSTDSVSLSIFVRPSDLLPQVLSPSGQVLRPFPV
jgi:hypothetical protein